MRFLRLRLSLSYKQLSNIAVNHRNHMMQQEAIDVHRVIRVYFVTLHCNDLLNNEND